VISRVSGTFSLALRVSAVDMELANKDRISKDSVHARLAISVLTAPCSATQNCVRTSMGCSRPCATQLRGDASASTTKEGVGLGPTAIPANCFIGVTPALCLVPAIIVAAVI